MKSGIILEMKQINSTEYDEMLQVWESSVRATHDFLTETKYKFLIIFLYFLKCS